MINKCHKAMLARLLFLEQLLPSVDACEAACSVLKMIHKLLKDCMCSSLLLFGWRCQCSETWCKFGKYFPGFPHWHGIASRYGMKHVLATLMIYPDLATPNRYAHGGCVVAFQYRKKSTVHLLEKGNVKTELTNWTTSVSLLLIFISLWPDKLVSSAWTVKRVSTSSWMRGCRRGSSILFGDRTVTVTMHGINFLYIRDYHYNHLETLIVTIKLLSSQKCFHYCYCYYCYCYWHCHCHSHCRGHCHCYY